MNFHNLNNFNVLVNTWSGNFFPLTEKKTKLGLSFFAYMILVWFIGIAYITLTMIGLLCYLPLFDALRTGGTAIAIAVEGVLLAAYLIYQRKYLRILIQKINSILVDSDDLRRCIRDSIEPYEKGLKLYAFLNMSTWLIWEVVPLVKILQADEFTYTDFIITMYFPGAPFTVNVFVVGIVFRTLGGGYVMLRKIGVDVYINYFITLLTAQYRFIEERTAAALREKDEILVLNSMKECVIYQCNAMKIGQILVDLLSFSVGVTYINCVFRFCFTAFSLMTLPGFSLAKFLMAVFGMSSLMQVYLLCSCIQDLLEASTSVANEAFYTDWQEHGRTVRRFYRTVRFGDRIECRLTAFGIFDLTVPTVAAILKQSYSVCLLLMRFQ